MIHGFHSSANEKPYKPHVTLLKRRNIQCELYQNYDPNFEIQIFRIDLCRINSIDQNGYYSCLSSLRIHS